MGRLHLRLWNRLRTWRAVRPLLSSLLFPSFFRLLLRRLPLGRLLLCGLLAANLFGLLLCCLLLNCLLFANLISLLLLCRLLTASLLRLLLCCLLLRGLLLSSLLFAGLVSLLLCRRRTVVANWLSLFDWRNRYWRTGRLVRWYIRHRYIRRRVGWPIGWCICHRSIAGPIRGKSLRRLVSWLPGVANGRRVDRSTCTQRCRLTWWRLLDSGWCGRSIRRTQALHFVDGQRLAGVLCQFLLLPGKRYGRWRRSCLCHHRTIDNCFRRPSHTIGGWGRCSEGTFSARSHHRSRYHRRRGNLFFVHRHGRSRHRRRASERVLRDS